MALTAIANGDFPSGTIVNNNFLYLDGLISGGQTIKLGTYAALRTFAALNPTVAFQCIATDNKLFLLYCGDVTQGSGGFITLADWSGAAVNTTEVG